MKTQEQKTAILSEQELLAAVELYLHTEFGLQWKLLRDPNLFAEFDREDAVVVFRFLITEEK